MYTRVYNEDGAGIIIPEKYGGTSFGQAENSKVGDEGKNPWEKDESVHTEAEAESEEAVQASASAQRIPLGGMLSKIFKNDTFGLQQIGKEELLIIATAAFLLFSKEGDKECAIMLILLLFLK